MLSREAESFFLSFLSLYTATRPRGHSRQVGAASASIRQKKLKCSKEMKSMKVKDKNR